jgi:excinuclease ABC subunit A
MACVNCGINVPPLEPRSFSFNSAYGACKRCHGLGTILEVDAAKIIPDPNLSVEKLSFIGSADKQGSAYLRSALLALLKHFKADGKAVFAELPKEIREAFFMGLSGQLNFTQGAYSYSSPWKGALRWLRERQ